MPTPYYDHAGNKGRFVKGDPKLKEPKSEMHRKAIAEGQRRAWSSKRQRMPIGSKWIDASGYVRVKVVAGKGRWRLEHALNMEREIGRTLRRGEIVHHIDGDKTNNATQNLYLCRDHQHHMEIEKSLLALFRELLRCGTVRFNHMSGGYER